MADLNHYLAIPYRNFGRDASGLDCWGLVRLVAHEWFGFPWMPMHDDCHPDDKKMLTLCHDALVSNWQSVERPEAGDIVAGYIGKRCIHVGIGVEADHRFRVLHTRRNKGPSLLTPQAFASEYQRIRWWRYAAP